MLYRILKILSRITLFSYFKKLEIKGEEHLKSEEPYLVVANHPSTFMDPIVLAVIIRFKIYFLAAAEYMGKGLMKKIMNKWFHMIPVYRPTTRPGEGHKNQKMFDYCYQHLASKKSLLIFPEGVSITSQHLHPLKTGVARIALGAEEKNDFKLGLKILPIGLNYSNPHAFRSNLLINIEAPITVNEFIDRNKDENTNIDALMSEIRLRLENAVVHLEELEDSQFLSNIQKLLRYFESTKPKTAEDNFEIIKTLNQYLLEFKDQESEKINALQQQSQELFEFCSSNSIDLFSTRAPTNKGPWRIFSFIFGFPIFLIGFLFNFIPYKTVGFLTRKLNLSETFEGAISMAGGMVLFTLWYLALMVTGYFVYLDLWAIFIPFLAYSTGIYAILYGRLLNYLTTKNKTKRILAHNEGLKKELNSQLKSIYDLLYYFQEKIEKTNSSQNQ